MGQQAEETLQEWFSGLPENGPLPEESVTRLSRFLQGFQLGLAADEEPFVALYDCGVAQRCMPELTNASAALLDRWLAADWEPSLRERAQYNLLHLCTEIGDGERLGDRVWELYRRRMVSGIYQSFRPVPLTKALLGAMIRNQIEGDRPLGLWQRFLCGEPGNYLIGSRLDGFLGMLYVIGNASQREKTSHLATCLLQLHNQIEENIFLSALLALGRVQPGIAVDVLRRAGLDVCEQYENVVLRERGRTAINSTLHDKSGNSAMKESLESAWDGFSRIFVETLRHELAGYKLPTGMQIEGLYSSVMNRTLGKYTEQHFRTLLKHARALSSLREPEAVKRQLKQPSRSD